MNKFILFASVAFLCLSLSVARPGMKRSKRAIDRKLLEDFVRSLAKKSDDDETQDDENKCILADDELDESKNDKDFGKAMVTYCEELTKTLTLYDVQRKDLFKFLHAVLYLPSNEIGQTFVKNVVKLFDGTANLLKKNPEKGKELISKMIKGIVEYEETDTQRKKRSLESTTEKSEVEEYDDCIRHLLSYACYILKADEEVKFERDLVEIKKKGKEIVDLFTEVLHSMNTMDNSGVDGVRELMFLLGSKVTSLFEHVEEEQSEINSMNKIEEGHITQLEGYNEEDDTKLDRALKEFVRKYMGQKNRQ